jgi:uncharacterized protein YjbJ (UPF0337 family)
MDKYLGIFEAFVGFLKALLGNVIGDKLGAAEEYEPYIKAIFDEAKKAFKKD